MESRTALLLDQLRKSPRREQLVVVRSLLEDLGRPTGAPATSTPSALGPKELAELQRRLAAIDDTISADELIDRVASSPVSGRSPPKLSPERAARLQERLHTCDRSCDLDAYIHRL